MTTDATSPARDPIELQEAIAGLLKGLTDLPKILLNLSGATHNLNQSAKNFANQSTTPQAPPPVTPPGQQQPTQQQPSPVSTPVSPRKRVGRYNKLQHVAKFFSRAANVQRQAGKMLGRPKPNSPGFLRTAANQFAKYGRVQKRFGAVGRKLGRKINPYAKQMAGQAKNLGNMAAKLRQSPIPAGVKGFARVKALGKARVGAMALRMAGGAMGGAGSAATGVAGVAATVGALAAIPAAAVAVVTALEMMGSAAEKQSRTMLESQRALAKASPEIAMIMAQSDIRDLRRMRESGRATGASTGLLADTTGDLADAMRPSKNTATNISNIAQSMQNWALSRMIDPFNVLFNKANTYLDIIARRMAKDSKLQTMEAMLDEAAAQNQRDRRNGRLQDRNHDQEIERIGPAR